MEKLHKAASAIVIQLSEDIIEDDDRLGAIAALHEKRGQAQRQREGPRLAVGGKALRWLSAEHEDHVITVRTQQGGAALDFLRALIRKCLQQGGFGDLGADQG